MISGITTFWCSTFILPKACVKRINSLCGVFLWKGNIEDHHTARVSWNEVTKPKKEGGLGINDLLLWNKACCLKLIWLLFFQAGSVWVAWFKEEVLNGDLRNLWTTAPNRRFSWQVNKLLKLSPLIYKWIHLRVSNGLSCQFWTDNWSPFGSLRVFFNWVLTLPWGFLRQQLLLLFPPITLGGSLHHALIHRFNYMPT